MHTRLLVSTIVLGALLWGILAQVQVQTAHAQSGCAAAYVVQPGDWLIAIARRFHTTVREMVRLNPQIAWRIDYLYAGEILCVPAQPAPPPPTPKLPLAQPILSFEAEYTIPKVQEMTMTFQAPMTTLGLRRTWSLQATGAVSFITTTEQISSTINGTPTPVLVAFQNDFGTAPNLTLYEIGSPNLLSSLRLNNAKPLAITDDCKPLNLNDAYQIPADQPMSLTVWLQGVDGSRFPFRVSQIGNASVASLSNCDFIKDAIQQSFMTFAIMPSASASGEYRAVTFLKPESGGPCDGCPMQFICGALGPWGEYICTMVQ
jgi:LysM repeat protein